MELNGAELVVKALRAEGVEVIFGVIGSSILDLADAIARSPGLRFVPTQTEQAAAYMADGYARVTGKPGVCCATVGPGATNLLGGVAQAFLESSPVIALVGEIHTKHYGKGASNFHEIEQSLVFKPVTKWSVRIERTDRIPELTSRAFRVATTGRKGPVYVGLPRDVQKNKLPEPRWVPPEQSKPAGVVRGDAAEIRRAARLLVEAVNPVILVGGGVRWAGARESVLKLAERASIPVAMTHKGLVPEDHPLVAGIIQTSGSPVAAQIVRGADVILALGCTFSQVATGSYGHAIIPEKGRIIHVDIDPEEIGKNYPVELGIVGDARAVVEDLFAEMEQIGQNRTAERLERLEVFSGLKAQWDADQSREMASDRVPITRLRMQGDLRNVLERNAIVAAESGATHGWMYYGFPCYEPILEPGEYSIMGSGLCMAMGAKVAYPERQVVSVTGDGAFMMVCQELATAVANRIDIVVVVPHNDIYGNMYNKQHTHFGDRFTGTQLYVPNLAELARAFGAHGERVERPEELIPAYRRALECGKPAVVDVIIGREFAELEAPTKLRVEDRY